MKKKYVFINTEFTDVKKTKEIDSEKKYLDTTNYQH